MILAWWLFFAALTATISLFVAWALASRYSSLGMLFGGLAAVAGMGALVFLIAGLVVGLGRHYGRISCDTFSVQTHRPTRFVIYSPWDGGDCLTPDGRGHWIPTKNLREFGSKP